MDLKVIKNLLRLIADSDVNEVEIEEGDFKIRVKKQPDNIVRETSGPFYMGNPGGMDIQMHGSPAPADLSQAPKSSSSAPKTEPTVQTSGKNDSFITVRSPIVGTLYRSPSPEAGPFVNVDDTVSKGDVLCIIEAMKIMNEIESEYSGKIVKILADDAQPVEFDQPLFLIDPS